jgi:hypothetical protein
MGQNGLDQMLDGGGEVRLRLFDPRPPGSGRTRERRPPIRGGRCGSAIVAYFATIVASRSVLRFNDHRQIA